MTPTTLPPHVLDTLRTDVRAGRSYLITYDHPDGLGWLDVHGPDGMRGGGDDSAFTAPIPTVRLWPPGGGPAPLAEAVANRAFPIEHDRLAERARPLVRHEYPTLLLVLGTIREATEGLRFRLPEVGDAVRMIGRPAVSGWMSCIPLGDLQAAILQSANRKAPILAWLAERYSEELSRNVVRGMKSQAEKGYWQHGHAPYGYAIVDGRLVVTDDVRAQFEVVKRVFRDTLDGVGGARAIADRLTREGVKPPGRDDMPRQYAAGTWRAKHVASILTNPLYCGHLVYDGEVAARSVHEAAVSDDDFGRVLAIRALKARNREEGEGNGENVITASQRGILTPFLRCTSCGGPVCVTAGGQPKKRTYLYTCRSRQESSAACSGISMRVEKLDALVLAAIEEHVLAPEALDAILANALGDLASSQVDALAGERERLTNVIAELDRKIRLTATHAINGMIDESDAKAITAPLLAQRDHARLQLAALPAANPTPETDTIDPDAFREAVREAWRAQPLEERRHAISRVVEKVELSPGGLEIICRADGYHGHDPFGPPNPPMSLVEPSVSA